MFLYPVGPDAIGLLILASFAVVGGVLAAAVVAVHLMGRARRADRLPHSRPRVQPRVGAGATVSEVSELRAREPRLASFREPARKGFSRDATIGRDAGRAERQAHLDDLQRRLIRVQRGGAWTNEN